MLFIDAKITVSRSQHKAKRDSEYYDSDVETRFAIKHPWLANAKSRSISVIDYAEIKYRSRRAGTCNVCYTHTYLCGAQGEN